MRQFILAALIAGPALAAEETGFYCKERLVKINESRAEVELKCDPPTSRDRRIETTPGLRVVTVDEWFYNFGPQRFVRTLTFENGKLVRIEVGDYGR